MGQKGIHVQKGGGRTGMGAPVAKLQTNNYQRNNGVWGPRAPNSDERSEHVKRGIRFEKTTENVKRFAVIKRKGKGGKGNQADIACTRTENK